jgi:carboxymethylenebutenolidase
MTTDHLRLWTTWQLRLLAAIACCSCGLAAPTFAADDRLENSPRHHEWVDVSNGDRKIHTFVVFPEVSEPATTVVLIHEIMGLTDWVRSVADQLAEAGYLVVAPDLLSGTGANGGGTESYATTDAAIKAVSGLPADQVTADLDAVVAYAKSIPSSNKTIAVSGFCWGGGQAFKYAGHNPNIATACVFYGPAPPDNELSNINCPVYGFYGREDGRITVQVPGLEKKMKELGKTYEPVIYDRARHGFMRIGDQTEDENDPNRIARNQAWERWKTVLGGLGAKQP